MVEKKGELKKQEIILGVSFLIICSIFVFVYAAGIATVLSPITKYNYSGSINISVNTTVNSTIVSYNATLFCNASSGAVDVANVPFWDYNTSTIFNQTEADEVLNGSVDTSGLVDALYHNCSIYADNGTDQVWTTAINVTIDNTAPNVSTFYTTSNGGNYSGTIVINASVSDATRGIDSVYFNITNSSGTQINWTKASGSNYYNLSVNTLGFVDGKYNITVYANDTFSYTMSSGLETATTNLNDSEKIQITIDNTIPTASFSCTPATVNAGSVVTCSCSPSDVTAGINTSQTTYTASPSTSNTGTYTQTCSYYDTAGNFATSSATYVVQLSSPGASSGSGTTATTFTYTKTIPQTSQEFSKVQKIETSTFSGGGLGAKERVKIKINSEEHFVGVRTLTETSATIEIASNPVQVELNIGEDAKVDINDDGSYDIYLKLNGITSGKADVTIEYLSEAIPDGSGPVSTTGETVTPGEETGIESGTNLTWLWIVIGIIVVALIVWVFMRKIIR